MSVGSQHRERDAGAERADDRGELTSALSVVIVTYNSSHVVEACTRSVRSLIPGAEVIVVDNASTDATTQLCEQLDQVELIANAVNVGYGRACNQGAQAASGSQLLFLNPDVEITVADLTALEGERRRSPFGLVAPVLQRGARATRRVRHWSVDLVSHVLGPLCPRELPAAPTVVIRRGDSWWPAGAILLVDREEFLGLGGFDRRFFLYYEDLDLVRRYRAAGLPIRRTRAMRARHQQGTSSGAGSTGVARDGWSYLSWIEYLSTWHGRDTAVRAAKIAGLLRRQVYLALGVLARAGPASGRARRKRLELAELDQFLERQSRWGDVTGDADFCPQARAIESTLRGSER